MDILSSNPIVDMLNSFYVKKNETDIKLASLTNETKKAITNVFVEKTLEYSWNHGESKTLFNIVDNKDELTGEDLSILHNVSFIHSILYLVDSSYYSSLASQKMKDCLEFIEVMRKDIYSKQKMTKEMSDILNNLDNHIYSDNTIATIINYFNCFHLIVLPSDSTEEPKLFVNGKTKETKDSITFKSASALIILYYDNIKETYYPVLYNVEDRNNLFISWQEPEFLMFIKNVFLWGKPIETKKWAVANLRSWITFFELPIDISLDKKNILAALPTTI